MNKEYKKLSVAFTGPSNSGKTTLVIKIASILQAMGNKVVIIKHDPKDKASFDKEGKDSFKFFQTGADVAVISPRRTTIFRQNSLDMDSLTKAFGDFDYMLVEGLKTLPLPRIAVMRKRIDEKYFDVTDVIASDDSIDKTALPKGMLVFDLNNPDSLIPWIEQNAKKV